MTLNVWLSNRGRHIISAKQKYGPRLGDKIHRYNMNILGAISTQAFLDLVKSSTKLP